MCILYQMAHDFRMVVIILFLSMNINQGHQTQERVDSSLLQVVVFPFELRAFSRLVASKLCITLASLVILLVSRSVTFWRIIGCRLALCSIPPCHAGRPNVKFLKRLGCACNPAHVKVTPKLITTITMVIFYKIQTLENYCNHFVGRCLFVCTCTAVYHFSKHKLSIMSFGPAKHLWPVS